MSDEMLCPVHRSFIAMSGRVAQVPKVKDEYENWVPQAPPLGNHQPHARSAAGRTAGGSRQGERENSPG
jgi:hypothetical protein